jgi:hypothetical protein
MFDILAEPGFWPGFAVGIGVAGIATYIYVIALYVVLDYLDKH